MPGSVIGNTREFGSRFSGSSPDRAMVRRGRWQLPSALLTICRGETSRASDECNEERVEGQIHAACMIEVFDSMCLIGWQVGET